MLVPGQDRVRLDETVRPLPLPVKFPPDRARAQPRQAYRAHRFQELVLSLRPDSVPGGNEYRACIGLGVDHQVWLRPGHGGTAIQPMDCLLYTSDAADERSS